MLPNKVLVVIGMLLAILVPQLVTAQNPNWNYMQSLEVTQLAPTKKGPSSTTEIKKDPCYRY
jgi:hypothetical protein